MVWSVFRVLTKMITVLLLLVSFYSATHLAEASKQRALSFECPTDRVYGLVSQNESEIDLNQAELVICNQRRLCRLSYGVTSCPGKGNYVNGITVQPNGTISKHGCCQANPPIEEHEGDDCSHQLHIEAMDLARVVTTPSGPLPGKSSVGSRASADDKVTIVRKYNMAKGIPGQHVKSVVKTDKGYTITMCTPRCSRSTSTSKRPSTQTARRTHPPVTQPPHPTEKAKNGIFKTGHHCFSGDMTVITPQGAKRMDQVRAGDEVMVTTASDSKPVFEPIEWLYHRDPRAIADFISVTTKSGQTLRLSANHLIPIIPCDAGNLTSAVALDRMMNVQSRFARRLKPGHCLAVMMRDQDDPRGLFEADHVISVKRERLSGIYSPITSRGTLIVNDVLVSCYSCVENHAAQKIVHSVIINFRKTASKIWTAVFGGMSSLLVQEDSEIPMSLRMLLKMAQFVVPASTVFGVN